MGKKQEKYCIKTIIIIAAILLILSSFPLISSQSQTFDWRDQCYYTYEELTALLVDLEHQYPDIFQYISLGKTHENRDIWAIKISDNVGVGEEEPQILITGGVHGNEAPGYEVVIFSLKAIVENYSYPHVNSSFTQRICDIVNTTELYFIPMVNPDGIESFSRKNGRPNECILGDSLFRGVDINRNFGYKWEEFEQHPFKYILGHIRWEEFLRHPFKYIAKGFPIVFEKPNVMYPFFDFASLYHGGHYRGPYPFSENESLAIKNFVDTHNITLSVDYHSFGERIVYPWTWTDETPKDEELFKSISSNVSKINNYTPIQGGKWYYVVGSNLDWLYGEKGIFSFTIELFNITRPWEFRSINAIHELCNTHLLVNLYLAELSSELS